MGMQLLSPILIAISLWYVRFSRYGVFVYGHGTRTYIDVFDVGAGPVPAHIHANVFFLLYNFSLQFCTSLVISLSNIDALLILNDKYIVK